jgi:ATP-dependent Clp protease adaptor protein ClpS
MIVGALYATGNRHHVPALAALTLLALLLIPNRIQAYFWSDLVAGFHHLNRRDYVLSKTHSQRFLAQLAARPWLKKLIWLGPTAYSRDAEALARNNLGAAMWKLGELEAAQEQLLHAIVLDPRCPLPHHNMGELLLNATTMATAMPWLEKAEALGFPGSRGRMLLPPYRPLQPVSGAFVLELINDDLTKMEFVVTALEQLFGLTGAEAIMIMLTVHRDGSAVCAGFDTEAVAQAKADELTALARASGFPLSCRVVAR